MASPAITSPSSWRGASITSITQFSPSSLDFLFRASDAMRRIVESRGGCALLAHRVLANVFYEPSTRTACSFAAAMQRLGGSVLSVSETTSSAVKGETLADSVRALACYADVVVLRHPVQGSAAIAAAASSVPVLNAGDGVGEHPTQALLDAATIRGELGGVAGKRVVLVGDLKHGRTVHSLVRLLALLRVESVTYVAPTELSLPDDIQAELRAQGVRQAASASLDDAVADADVLYVTRVQKERFVDADEYERLKHAFVVTAATMARAQPRMIVMHPLPCVLRSTAPSPPPPPNTPFSPATPHAHARNPSLSTPRRRVGEIAEEVDADPRAAYFKQMRYGLFLRMAILALTLGVSLEAIEAEGARGAE
jgi:aspartate carbamoyltransferase